MNNRDHYYSNNKTYRNGNNYYKHKYPSSTSNLTDRRSGLQQQSGSSDNLSKPMFINTKLNENKNEGENNDNQVKFADLKQEGDLFLKKMQQMEKEKEMLATPHFENTKKDETNEEQQNQNEQQDYKEAYEEEYEGDGPPFFRLEGSPSN